MELCSVLCANLDGRGVGEKWICVYVWLSSFAVYLNYHNIVNGLTPIQNKRSLKK